MKKRFIIEFTVEAEDFSDEWIKGQALQELNCMSPFPEDIDFHRKDNPWHTGTPTEEGYYLIAFHPWGRKENGICYSCLEWKDNRWFDRVYDCDTEPYLIAWKKIEEPYKED